MLAHPMHTDDRVPSNRQGWDRGQIPPHPSAGLTPLCGSLALLEGNRVAGVRVLGALKKQTSGLTP